MCNTKHAPYLKKRHPRAREVRRRMLLDPDRRVTNLYAKHSTSTRTNPTSRASHIVHAEAYSQFQNTLVSKSIIVPIAPRFPLVHPYVVYQHYSTQG